MLPPAAWLQAIPWLGGPSSVPTHPDPAASGPIIYYRDPDGRAAYSAEPRKTPDGRDFLAVHASEDIGFDDKPETEAAPPASGQPKKVLYYRNPMGLPDTSPVPKKDSMGMDYIPVYTDEDEGGSTVKIAPGKLQRIGVRAETVAKLRAEYEKDIDIVRLASELVIDAIVEPEDLRAELIARLSAARGKDRTFSRRRHGVSPV